MKGSLSSRIHNFLQDEGERVLFLFVGQQTIRFFGSMYATSIVNLAKQPVAWSRRVILCMNYGSGDFVYVLLSGVRQLRATAPPELGGQVRKVVLLRLICRCGNYNGGSLQLPHSTDKCICQQLRQLRTSRCSGI
jgi:hypothetical protein